MKMQDNFNKFLSEELDKFLTTYKVSGIKFAEAYGTTPVYVSKMRNGHRNLDIATFAQAVHKLGYKFIIDIPNKKLVFV